MRISDWSSDVCSSDLRLGDLGPRVDLEGDPQRGVLRDPLHAGDRPDGDAGDPNRVARLETGRVLEDDLEGIGAFEDAQAADGEGNQAEDKDGGGSDQRLMSETGGDNEPIPSWLASRSSGEGDPGISEGRRGG